MARYQDRGYPREEEERWRGRREGGGTEYQGAYDDYAPDRGYSHMGYEGLRDREERRTGYSDEHYRDRHRGHAGGPGYGSGYGAGERDYFDEAYYGRGPDLDRDHDRQEGRSRFSSSFNQDYDRDYRRGGYRRGDQYERAAGPGYRPDYEREDHGYDRGYDRERGRDYGGAYDRSRERGYGRSFDRGYDRDRDYERERGYRRGYERPGYRDDYERRSSRGWSEGERAFQPVYQERADYERRQWRGEEDVERTRMSPHDYDREDPRGGYARRSHYDNQGGSRSGSAYGQGGRYGPARESGWSDRRGRRMDLENSNTW